MKQELLIVDDEPAIRAVVREILQATYDVAEAADGRAGLAALSEHGCDVLITDVKMPGGGGGPLVAAALEADPDLAVIVISGLSSVPEFIEFLRLGVTDCLLKPFAPADLQRAVARAAELRRLRLENRRLRAALPAPLHDLDALVGESPLLVAVKERIARCAGSDSPVLITGSPGTGKHTAARTIHELSARRSGAFVAVSCAALPPHLLEPELFGLSRVANGGSERARAGRFAEAQGGTLYIDEVGLLPGAVQQRLLRALSDKDMRRVGETRARPLDVRLVAATTVAPAELLASGALSEELFYRLNVLPLRLPDLVERLPDVPLLVRRMVADACRRIGRARKSVSGAALRRLLDHSWPGNVRELQNAVERAVILCGEHATIEGEDILLTEPSVPRSRLVELPAEGLELRGTLARLERDYIRLALERTGHNRQHAARLLHMERTTLSQKLTRYGLRGEPSAEAGADAAPAREPGSSARDEAP